MNRRILSAVFLVIPMALLTSCSGVNHVINCSGATCVNNNGTVSLVLTATPPDPSSQLSIQAFTATITGITLTSAGGNSVSVQLNSTTYIAEFNRVTSDSTILADGASIPADTYNQIKISFSAPRVTFCTQTNPGVPGCTAGTLKSVSGAAGSATASINLSLGVNQPAGLTINVNLGSTLTLNGQNITAVNLGAASVFGAAALPPASTATDLAAGELSHVDDVMGTITAINSNVITLQTTTRGSITAGANSSTQFDTSCASPSVTGCIHVNDVAVIDAVLNSDSTFTLVYYQPLLSASTDVIEGIVTGVPNSVTNQFPIVITDTVFASSGSILSGRVNLGDQILVTLTPGQNFSIIAKGLSLPIQNFTSSNSVASILPGQTLAIPVSSFTAQSGATPGAAGTTQIALRFSRITGTMTSVALPFFSGTSFPSFYGFPTSQEFGTTNGRLSLDGVSALTSISNGSTFSTSALYIGSPSSPQLVAQTVRAH